MDTDAGDPGESTGAIRVCTLGPRGLSTHDVAEIPSLLRDRDVVTWVDVPCCDEHLAGQIAAWFSLPVLEMRECATRNHISKFRIHDDHVFTVLHAPDPGEGGHVHYVELDQFVGATWLLTVHGPLNPAVAPSVAGFDTDAVYERIRKGEFRPMSSWQLSYGIVSAMIARETQLVADLAGRSGVLEQQVTDTDPDDPEQLLEALFEVGHQLLAVRTIAGHSAVTYGAVGRSETSRSSATPTEAAQRSLDLADRFEMVRSMADGQKDFVSGVIDFYRTRTDTHQALATERVAETSVRQNDDMRKISAWVAIVAVPTAVTGFFGQNVPYPGSQTFTGFLVSAALIVVGAVVLYLVFRAKRWL